MVRYAGPCGKLWAASSAAPRAGSCWLWPISDSSGSEIILSAWMSRRHAALSIALARSSRAGSETRRSIMACSNGPAWPADPWLTINGVVPAGSAWVRSSLPTRIRRWDWTDAATRASASGMLGPLVATVSSSSTCTVCMLASRAAWYASCSARYRAVGAGRERPGHVLVLWQRPRGHVKPSGPVGGFHGLDIGHRNACQGINCLMCCRYDGRDRGRSRGQRRWSPLRSAVGTGWSPVRVVPDQPPHPEHEIASLGHGRGSAAACFR